MGFSRSEWIRAAIGAPLALAIVVILYVMAVGLWGA